MSFLERLKNYMSVSNIKQIDIINKNKSLSKGYVSMVVNGKRQPNTEFLNALSQLSGKSINWWLHGKDDYDNLYSLNTLLDFFIDNGSIDRNGNMDDETKDIIDTMLKKEIRVKLQKKYNIESQNNITKINNNDELMPVAAHANKNATDEDIKHDIDIMNDDSEW